MVCTCKAFKNITLCAHVVAVTALYKPMLYDEKYSQTLIQSLRNNVRKAHRPKRARGCRFVQPEEVDNKLSNEEREIRRMEMGYDDQDRGEISSRTESLQFD